MIMAGERRITEVLVIGKGPALVSLCGDCRQRLHEFANDTTPVHMCDTDGLRCTVTLGELLPLSMRAAKSNVRIVSLASVCAHSKRVR
jgi:cytidine deaminase